MIGTGGHRDIIAGRSCIQVLMEVQERESVGQTSVLSTEPRR